MREVATFSFNDHKGIFGLGTVYLSFDGHYIPDSPALGMGHNYTDPKQAANDLLRRHGATLINYHKTP